MNNETNIFNRFGHTSNIIGDNLVFHFGGAKVIDRNYETNNNSLLYDIECDNWTVLKNEGNIPEERAAHSSCTIDTNQVLIFGGAKHGGIPSKNILYKCTIINNEKAIWKEIKIEGNKPGRRYGHTMLFSKPYVIIYGGSYDNEILNETWILNINEDKLKWIILENLKVYPTPRLYHSSDICKSGGAAGMIIIYGGRDRKSKTLNDIWGLRRHRTGEWEWLKGPDKNWSYIPKGRFQHKSIFLGSLMFNIGGKIQENVCSNTLDIYDAEQNNWISVNFYEMFRHTFWLYNGKAYFYGGLDKTNKAINNDNLKVVDIINIFPDNTNVKNKIIQFSKINLNISGLSSRNNSPMSTKSNSKMEIEYQPKESVVHVQHPYQKKKTINNSNPEIHKIFLKKLLQPQTYINLAEDSEFMFSEEEILQLIFKAEEIIKNQSIILKVQSPAKVFGDIHGQYSDLMRFFDLWGSPYNADEDTEGDIDIFNYVFLGDYVDRGSHSLETICLLLSLKCMYPNEIHLIRGNHEDRCINNSFGFLDECEERLGDMDSESNPDSVFNRINDLFEYLPLIAVIDEKILCIHGGIGQNFKKLNQLNSLQRPIPVIHEVSTDEEKLIVDILWSDPTDNDEEFGVQPNIMRDPQGTGNIVKFGPDIVEQFLKNNNLVKIIRAHECVMDGIERFADGKLITVFSATDYCGKHKNAGAVLYFTKDYDINVKLIYPENMQQANWMENNRPITPPRWRNSPGSNI